MRLKEAIKLLDLEILANASSCCLLLKLFGNGGHLDLMIGLWKDWVDS